MSLEKNIAAIERALGRPLTEARKLACQITDASQNTAYQAPAGAEHAPQLPKPELLGSHLTESPNLNEQANGVGEIVRGK